jgi:DNA-binding NarL/FixJ family response regulator
MTVRVLLVDDHQMIREGLRSLLGADPDLEVVGEAGDGEVALDRIQALRPDLVLLDISMPGRNGIQVMQRLRSMVPAPRVLVLTAFSDIAYVRLLMEQGAAGYLLKSSTSRSLIDAIRSVMSGGTYLDPGVAGKLVARLTERKMARGEREGAPLSDRETEVLRLIALGYTNKEIAGQLRISGKTVESHRANIMEKLGLATRADLVRYALRQGWLERE